MDSATKPRWHPALYAANARFVSTLGQPVVELLGPLAGERILDLGCGDGVLAAQLQSSGCRVVGVDASPEMVATAGRLGLDARVMSGDALTFTGEFDAVFSNAALHWMRTPAAVVAGVWRALRPGGRFVAEMGGAGNIAAIVQAIEAALAARDQTLRNPWYFPTADEYRRLLEQQGFIVRQIELFARPTPLPGNIRGWLAAFGEPLFGALPAEEREALADDVMRRLEPQLRGADGTWVADYVRLRFAAHRPD